MAFGVYFGSSALVSWAFVLFYCWTVFFFFNLLLNCCTERNIYIYIFAKWEKYIFYGQLNLIVWLCIKGYKSLLFQFQYQWNRWNIQDPDCCHGSLGRLLDLCVISHLWPLKLFSTFLCFAYLNLTSQIWHILFTLLVVQNLHILYYDQNDNDMLFEQFCN